MKDFFLKKGSKSETVPRVSINETSTTKIPSGPEAIDSGQSWKIVHHDPAPDSDADTIYVGNTPTNRNT